MISMVSGSVVAPVLPTIQYDFDISPAQIGWVMTAFSLPGFLFAPFIGLAADRYGRRAVIVPMLIVYGVAGGLTFFAWDFETLLIMRFIAGFGSSAASFLSITLVGDLFQRENRAAVLGYRLAAGQSANIALPPIAGAVAVFGWQYPFLIFILAIPVGLFALKVMEATPRAPAGSLATYLGEVWRALINPRIAGLLTVAPTMMIVGQGAVGTYLPIFMAGRFGATPLVIGLVFSARVVAGVTVSMLMGQLAGRFGGERLTIVALLLMALGLAWIPFVDSIWELLAPGVLLGIGSGLGFPAFQSLLINEAPEGMLATVTAANGMTNRLGQTTGPLMAAGLLLLGGIDLVYFGSAILLVVMVVFYLVIFRRK